LLQPRRASAIIGRMRRTREEILDTFRGCQAKLGKPPGRELFEKLTGIKGSEVAYYWPRHSALVAEAGGEPNRLQSRLPDDLVFKDYARVCLHVGKIPSLAELNIAQRELGAKTHTVDTRFGGGLGEFRRRFREWLEGAPVEFKAILQFEGWHTTRGGAQRIDGATTSSPQPAFHPFLPAGLQYLEVLARGERPPFEASEANVSTIFERRVADAFRCLGFEVTDLGQGTGRKPDALAVAARDRFAVVIDSKARGGGYVLGTEDRKFLEYARSQGAELQRRGLERVYLAIVSSSFSGTDPDKLAGYVTDSPIRAVTMIVAGALVRLVESSIRERFKFTLANFERELFRHKIIPA
jgi:hypothetical protein